jgi:outer membrane protein OmpA-like peptidoglycan-associated protein
MKLHKLLLVSLLYFCFAFSWQNLLSQNPNRILLPTEYSGKNIQYPCVSFDNQKIIFMVKEGEVNYFFEANINLQDSTIIFSNIKKVEFDGFNCSLETKIKDPVYNHDANEIYFAGKLPDSKGEFDIYKSTRKASVWSNPENVGDKINTAQSEESPSITSDKNSLFFTRKIKEHDYKDVDCHTIYYAKLNDNKWDTPVELSTTINTGCESHPFISFDNKTLYYSSYRDEGKGGFDIYVTKMLAENIWNYPANISILNSEFDEIASSVSSKKNILIYNQVSKVKKTMMVKPYSSHLASGNNPDKTFIIEGIITAFESQQVLDANIIIRDKENMQTISEFSSNPETGKYSIILPRGKNYEIEVYKQDYSHIYFNFNTRIAKETEIKKDFALYHSADLILNVFDAEIFEPLDSKITLKDNTGKELEESKIQYLEGGRIIANIIIGYNYTIFIEKEAYENYEFNFDLSGIVQFDEFEKDVELVPKKKEFIINIADIETDEAIDEVEIVITNLEKNERIVKRVKKDENGKFSIDLREGDQYEINVNGPKGYAFYNTKVDMKKNEGKKLDVKLKPLTAKTKLELNDITFETNSAELNVSSYEELDRVVKLLIDNPEIKIEISAHTDDVGSARYNLKLSDMRAQSVVDYLTSKELSIERVIAKGYGESAPLVPNDSEENKAKNRRVELKIIDISEQNETIN